MCIDANIKPQCKQFAKKSGAGDVCKSFALPVVLALDTHFCTVLIDFNVNRVRGFVQISSFVKPFNTFFHPRYIFASCFSLCFCEKKECEKVIQLQIVFADDGLEPDRRRIYVFL